MIILLLVYICFKLLKFQCIISYILRLTFLCVGCVKLSLHQI